MSFIYKITNDINDKVYIGKTAFSIEKRFKEHCKDAFKEHLEQRPLYSAMRKYGIEHFKVEQIEECDNSLASDREAYWIGVYQAYSKGYNATLGGEGKFLYNHDQIAKRLSEHPFPKDVANEFGCCIDTVTSIAHQRKISIKNQSWEGVKATSKKIACYDFKDNFISSFESTVAAAKWCYDQGYCKTLNSGVRAHISECANGKRKTAYKFIWRYI